MNLNLYISAIDKAPLGVSIPIRDLMNLNLRIGRRDQSICSVSIPIRDLMNLNLQRYAIEEILGCFNPY